VEKTNIETDVHSGWLAMTFAQHACTTGRAELNMISSTCTLRFGKGERYFVCHCLAGKFIVLQSSVAFLDGEAAGTWKDPYVTFAETDAAVAVHD